MLSDLLIGSFICFLTGSVYLAGFFRGQLQQQRDDAVHLTRLARLLSSSPAGEAQVVAPQVQGLGFAVFCGIGRQYLDALVIRMCLESDTELGFLYASAENTSMIIELLREVAVDSQTDLSVLNLSTSP